MWDALKTSVEEIAARTVNKERARSCQAKEAQFCVRELILDEARRFGLRSHQAKSAEPGTSSTRMPDERASRVARK